MRVYIHMYVYTCDGKMVWIDHSPVYVCVSVNACVCCMYIHMYVCTCVGMMGWINHSPVYVCVSVYASACVCMYIPVYL